MKFSVTQTYIFFNNTYLFAGDLRFFRITPTNRHYTRYYQGNLTIFYLTDKATFTNYYDVAPDDNFKLIITGKEKREGVLHAIKKDILPRGDYTIPYIFPGEIDLFNREEIELMKREGVEGV